MIFIAALIISLSSLYSMSKNDYYSISAYAADPNKIVFLKTALENGADPNQYPQYNMTPLQIAISKNNIEAIKLLLEYGADINAKNSPDIWTPLITICNRNVTFTTKENKKLIIFLLENGADPNFYSAPGMSPLFRANNDMIKILLLYGANPYLKSLEDWAVITVLENWKLLEKADYIKQTSKKLFLILTKLLHRGTVAGGIKLPLDMAKLIASYCYPQEKSFIGN